MPAEGQHLYVQLQYALLEVSALQARLDPAINAPVYDNPTVPDTIYEMVTSDPACGGEGPIDDSPPTAADLPAPKAKPIAKRLSQCQQVEDTSKTQRVAKTAPTARRVPSIPRSGIGRSDSTGGACAPGGDGDDPPDQSYTLIDDGRDGAPDEEDLHGPPPEPSPFVQGIFADPPRRPPGGEVHPPPFSRRAT